MPTISQSGKKYYSCTTKNTRGVFSFLSNSCFRKQFGNSIAFMWKKEIFTANNRTFSSMR